MKRFLLGTLCVIALGCNPNTPSGNQTGTPTGNQTGTQMGTQTHMNDGSNRQTIDRNNTGINVRDRDQAAKTPFSQHENKTDIDITAEIRRRVVDTEMSTNAHNVKIMTENGRVTLRGPVESLMEKDRIEALALAVAGEGRVDNQLEVKGE